MMNYIKLTFTGDLMSLMPQNKASYNPLTNTYDYNPIFGKISYLLDDSDYVIGNLETPIAGEDLKYTYLPTVFNTPIDFLQAIKNAGFDYVSIANNHCLDRKKEGLMNTIENIENMGLDYGGAYKNNAEANSVFIKDISGVRVALLSYTYGTNSKWQNNELCDEDKFLVDLFRKQDKYIIPHKSSLQPIKDFIKPFFPKWVLEKIRSSVILDCVKEEVVEDIPYLNRLEERIKCAKKNSDIVVMYMHSGGQYNSSIGTYTKQLVSKLEGMGCDLIVGNHPHCVLSCEYINKTFTLYSLGNFCFTPNWGYYYDKVYADYSIVFNIYIDKKMKEMVNKTFYVCKVVTQNNGHSVVYHIKDLYKEISSKEREILYADFLAVLSRLFNKRICECDINQTELNFDDFI